MISCMHLFTVLALLGATIANPVRNSCTPNFQGNALKVYTSSAEWTSYNSDGSQVNLAGFGAGSANQFLVEFTGQPTNAYHIKLVANTARNLQLTASNYGELSFEETTSNGSQDFMIECNRCSDSGIEGQNCVIFRPRTNFCVTGSYPGQTLFLAKCDGSNAQRYTFVQVE
ncbi:hypothetical protein BDZ94DRAFT_1231844 [Collybia nuda]|uniref:Uncharacterized protein n=1 Tax=Collybia nuda TaxID=64659 RepID=A0A9P5YGF4_9AGAR|nr:hypothetical protein BDZ94DRAFT_1231844 [Collybia nuda]